MVRKVVKARRGKEIRLGIIHYIDGLERIAAESRTMSDV